MAYTRAWDETHPFGTELAATLDTIIQNDKTDTRERIAGIFGLNLAQWTADPILPASLTLTGTLVAALLSGPLTGNVTGNLTGSVLTPAQANITSLGLLTSLNAAADPNNVQFKGSAGSAYIQLIGAPASGHFNWQIGKSVTVSGSLEFLPSTVVDGSTYTTPAAKLSQTGTLTCTTGNFTAILGTLQTAAQSNITSLGTQVAALQVNSIGILVGTSQGTNRQYLQFTNTGNVSYFGVEGSVGSVLVAGSLAYATVVGASSAQALQLYTNNAVRQTIDSAGNVVFTGTVTAANFVGPTTLDANNLTGTTLNSGVIHSSLKDLGTLTALNVTGAVVITGDGSNVLLNAPTSRLAIVLQQNAVTKGLLGVDKTQTLVTGSVDGDTVLLSSTNVRFSANMGSAIHGSVTTAGFVGNLTGTILTAAQANITSLGTLTGLAVTGSISSALAIFVQKDGSDTVAAGPYYQLVNVAFSAGWITQQSVGNHYDFWSYTGSWGRVGRFTQDGKLLIGTTTTTGVAAGGIHAAGSSVFDTSVQIGTAAGSYLKVASYSGAVTGAIIVGAPQSNYGAIGYNAVPTATNLTWNYGSSDYASIIHFPSGGISFQTAASGVSGNAIAFVERMLIAQGGAVTANGPWTFNSTVGGITTLTATTLTGTLSTAAQTNVTSLGILTSLTISSGASAGLTLQANNGTAHVQYKNAASTVNWLTYLNNAGADLVFYDNINGRNALTLALGASGQATFSHGVTATTFTGNVTGNLTGTVLTAAQANITSLGTLTGLTLNGNLTLSAATTKILVGATALAVKDSTDTTTIASFSGSGADFSVSSLSIKISTVVDNAGLQLLTNRRTGWSSPTATLSRTAVATGDTLATTISHLAALVQDIITHGMIGA